VRGLVVALIALLVLAAGCSVGVLLQLRPPEAARDPQVLAVVTARGRFVASLLDRLADEPGLTGLGPSEQDLCPVDDSGDGHAPSVVRTWRVNGSSQSSLAALTSQLERLGWTSFLAGGQGMTAQAPLVGADVAPTVVTQALTRIDVTATTLVVEVTLPGDC
jgi:hypothetical protein